MPVLCGQGHLLVRVCRRVQYPSAWFWWPCIWALGVPGLRAWNDPVPKFTHGERGSAMERPHGQQEPFERLLEARQS